MGNGAYLGWIHINRDAPPESEDFITVNYVYNRNALSKIKNAFLRPKSPWMYISKELADNAGPYAYYKYLKFDGPIRSKQPVPQVS